MFNGYCKPSYSLVFLDLRPLCHQVRREDAQNTHHNQHPAQGRGEEHRRIAVTQNQRTTQTVFTDRTQDETEHDGGSIQIKLTHEITDEAEDKHNDHFNEVIVDGVRAHDAQDED